MGALHLVQGAAMLALSSDFQLPVTTSFIEYQSSTDSLEPVRDTLFDVRLGPLIASFLLMSAVAHLALSAPGLFGWYVRNLGRGMNYARWVEYSFSASIMLVAVAMLVGIYDIAALLLIFGANAAMIMFGWMMERHNQDTEGTDWTAFVFGSIVGIVPWVAIGLYLWGAGGREGDVPTFVYWIYLSIFAFFNVFAINMVLQYLKVGRWRDYLFGEYVYILLSLTAKSALAWQVYAGTLQPS